MISKILIAAHENICIKGPIKKKKSFKVAITSKKHHALRMEQGDGLSQPKPHLLREIIIIVTTIAIGDAIHLIS